ncbi:MAG: Clp protease N-terminal domain-containing protein [Bryobacteraceae bacterium]
MFERYTEKARRVIFFARYESSQFGSPYIETEHLLLAVMRECPGLVEADAGYIRKMIESRAAKGAKIATSVDLPLSAASKRVLAYGAEEAERLGHRHIGAPHLLLGLFRETDGLAHALLAERGITLEAIRAKAMEPSADPSFVAHQVQIQELATVAAMAAALARKMNQEPQLLHLVLAILADEDGPAGQLLREHGITREVVLARLKAPPAV